MRAKAMAIHLSIFFIATLLAAGVAGPACAQVLAAETSEVLMAGDKLNIRVYREKELTAEWHGSSVGYSVDADGNLVFPLVGPIHAQGMTLEAFQKKLTSLLDAYIVNPQVTVSFYDKKVAQQHVSIMGKVVRPGNYAHTNGMTLIQLITEAGGFVQPTNDAPTAVLPDTQRVQITRQGASADQKVRTVDAQAIMGGLTPDVPLEPSDLVIVPTMTIRGTANGHVSVLGQVNRPGNYDLGTATSLVRLISDAQGFTRLAAQDRVVLTRKTVADKSADRVNVTAIMTGKAEDIALQPGDVVYVPESEF